MRSSLRALVPALLATVALVSAGSFTATLAAPTATSATPGPGPRAHGVRSARSVIAGTSAATVARIAKQNRITPAAVRRLGADPSAWVDHTGRIFLVEEKAAQAGSAAGPASAATAASPALPYADTFALHSLPGSKHTIYLDFVGGTVSGTGWNDAYGQSSVDVPPFDTDGDPTTWSNAELDTIQSVFQRVAEDYAPMDVDVTTEPPPPGALDRTDAADDTYGATVMISPTTFIASSCGCGGVSYVGSFDQPGNHAYYQPAWVFTSVNGDSPKILAEEASHEAGHTLGLAHDGTPTSDYSFGQGYWGPIMGASYFQPLSEFSDGDYAGASNQQDDYAVMASHGATILPDDVGDTQATAAALPLNTTVKGLITTREDVDVYSYSGDNPVQFSIQPSAVSPDLNITVTVIAGGTTTVYSPANTPATFDVVNGLGATFTVPADNDPNNPVYVIVDGTGEGDPLADGFSDYGSRGPYTITTQEIVPVGTPVAPPVAIGGMFVLAGALLLRRLARRG